MMISDAKMSFNNFNVVLLTLKQYIFSDFFFNQNVNVSKKSVDLCMKFNENLSRVKINQHFIDVLYTLLQDLYFL